MMFNCLEILNKLELGFIFSLKYKVSFIAQKAYVENQFYFFSFSGVVLITQEEILFYRKL